MTLNPLKSQVLEVFKKLHRTRQVVFAGDEKALTLGRVKINNEFKTKKHVTQPEAVGELVKLAVNVEKELRETVVRVEEVKPNVYQMRLTPNTFKFDNTDYVDTPEDQLPKRVKNKCKK